MKHRLAGDVAANLHPDRSAHELSIHPCLIAVGITKPMQLGISPDQFRRDPGPAFSRQIRAAGQCLLERLVVPHHKLGRENVTQLLARELKLIQRLHPPMRVLDPPHLAPFAHQITRHLPIGIMPQHVHRIGMDLYRSGMDHQGNLQHRPPRQQRRNRPPVCHGRVCRVF